MIHFILLGDDLPRQYRRALETADVHGRDRYLWYCGEKPRVPAGVSSCRVARPAGIPDDTPSAHIWDMIAYGLLFELGGTCLGLDTISVRPMEPLADGMDLGVGLDVPGFPYFHPDHKRWVDHPYNNNGISSPPGSSMAAWLYEESLMRVHQGGTWGATGPAILTDLVERNRDRVQIAPFPQLCGWEGSHTWRFYDGEEPSPDVRVIHLFAAAYPDRFQALSEQYEMIPT